MYTFLPTLLICNVLLKIKRDKAGAILVAPVWPRQHWFSIVLEFSIAPPSLLELPCQSDLLSQDNSQLLHLDLVCPILDGMEADWLKTDKQDYSSQVHQLVDSRKPSTKTSYLAKRRFSCWASSQGFPPLLALIQSILDYLLHLKWQGLET